MLHCSGFLWCCRLTSHHANEGDELLHEFGIGMSTLAWRIVETVFETYTNGGGSHADGTGEHREILHRVVGDTP